MPGVPAAHKRNPVWEVCVVRRLHEHVPPCLISPSPILFAVSNGLPTQAQSTVPRVVSSSVLWSSPTGHLPVPWPFLFGCIVSTPPVSALTVPCAPASEPTSSLLPPHHTLTQPSSPYPQKARLIYWDQVTLTSLPLKDAFLW